MSDDGFVTLQPPGKSASRAADVILTTFKVRTASRLSISIDPAFFGAERVIVAWNPATYTLRLVPDERGTFDVMRIGRSKRHVIRIDLPDGLQVVESKEPGPARVDGKALYVIVPPPLRKQRPSGEVARDAIATAKARVPAPNFSGKR